MKIGTRNNKKLLDITAIRSSHGSLLSSALTSLHAFTGNDYTSAFHGIGKAKAFKILCKSEEYQMVFENLGNTFTFDTDLFPEIERFVCELYGAGSCETTDEARYFKFCCSKSKLPEPQQLPPTRDALLCHCKRVSYVTSIIKSSLSPCPVIPSPDGYGWEIKDGLMEIQWMLRKPAPDVVLDLVSCSCKKKRCVSANCACKSHGLPCTDLCGCIDCENKDNVESDAESSDEYDSDF